MYGGPSAASPAIPFRLIMVGLASLDPPYKLQTFLRKEECRMPQNRGLVVREGIRSTFRLDRGFGILSVFTFLPYSAWGLWRSLFIGFSAAVVSLAVIQIYRGENSSQSNTRLRRKDREHWITSLDPDEWTAVNAFMQGRQNTIELPIDDPVVAGLRCKRILL